MAGNNSKAMDVPKIPPYVYGRTALDPAFTQVLSWHPDSCTFLSPCLPHQETVAALLKQFNTMYLYHGVTLLVLWICGLPPPAAIGAA